VEKSPSRRASWCTASTSRSNLGEKHTTDNSRPTSIVGDCFDETLFFLVTLICGWRARCVPPSLKTYICHAGGMAGVSSWAGRELNRSMAPDATQTSGACRLTCPTSGSTSTCMCRAVRRAVCEVVGRGTGAWLDQLRRRPTTTDDLDSRPRASDCRCAKKIRSGIAIELLKLSGPTKHLKPCRLDSVLRLTRRQLAALVCLTFFWALNWPIMRDAVQRLSRRFAFRALSMLVWAALPGARDSSRCGSRFAFARRHWPGLVTSCVTNMVGVGRVPDGLPLPSLSSGRASDLGLHDAGVLRTVGFDAVRKG